MGLFSRFRKTLAPDFPDHLSWIQGGPIRSKEMRGKVSLLFFFSYANVHCLYAFDFLRRITSTYKDTHVIGIHVPEHAFEKEHMYVRAALEKYKLHFPVVLDHDFSICDLFRNQWLPRFIVLGADGAIVHDHIGEGGYVATETAIQQALLRSGQYTLPDMVLDNMVAGGICYRTTPDLSLGYTHGSFIAQEEIQPFSEYSYTQTSQSVMKEGVVSLHGHWCVEKDYIEHTRDVPLAAEYISFLYSAFCVFVVMEPLRHGAEVLIDLDGKALPEDASGSDITYNKQGQSRVHLDIPRLYHLIDADTYHKGQVKLRVKDADIRFYSIFFDGCRKI